MTTCTRPTKNFTSPISIAGLSRSACSLSGWELKTKAFPKLLTAENGENGNLRSQRNEGGPPFMISVCAILAFFARVGGNAACATGLVTTRHESINLRLHSRLPPFANYAKNGAPAL